MSKIFGLILLLAQIASYAAIIEVPAGSLVQPYVNSSSMGDTIVLHDGTYIESIKILAHPITLGSLFLLDNDTTHIANTIIRADSAALDSQSCVIVSCNLGDTCRLVGLSFIGGAGTTLIFEIAYRMGGGVLLRYGIAEVRTCLFQGGNVDNGGGVAAITDDQLTPSKLIINNSRFENCMSQYWGGGIYAMRVNTEIANTILTHCISGREGGGFIAGNDRTDIYRCQFITCEGYTGGAVVDTDHGTINECVFDSNRTNDSLGICDLLSTGDVQITGNIFRNNMTNNPGIMIYENTDWSRPFFHRNIVENQVVMNEIGTMHVFYCGGSISHNIFRNNYGDAGASLSLSITGLALHVHHNSFIGNDISEEHREFGSCIFMNVRHNYYTIDSNQFVGNTGDVIGHVDYQLPTVIRARNNWWGSASGPYHPMLNPQGEGDTVSASMIEINPWLTEPPDTSLSSRMPEVVRPNISSTWELLAVYPNPFNSTLRIDLAGFTNSSFRVTLYNLLGRQLEVLHEGRMNGGTLTLNAPPGLANGIYFLQISDDFVSTTRKIVFLK